jgi:epoxyqueuosine reductase
MKEGIRQKARALGFDDCRFTTARAPESAPRLEEWLGKGFQGEMAYLERNAHKRVDPEKVLPGARSIITLATSYEMALASEPSPLPSPRGVVARYARFRDYHAVVGERLKSLSDFVNMIGGESTRSLWYVDTGPLLERDLAQRAGLGFIGKHTNVISRTLGNWIFLSEVITTLELEPDGAEKNRCGTCARCIAACPTQAIRAPFELDARRCISYLTIELKGAIPEAFRPMIGNRIYGCDDCLAVCPWNRFAQEAGLMKEHGRSDLATPDLVELLSLDEAGFKQKFAGTPMVRAKRRGLLRNVCVALGNVGDASHLPALERARLDRDALIAEHAQWAIKRISDRPSD